MNKRFLSFIVLVFTTITMGYVMRITEEKNKEIMFSRDVNLEKGEDLNKDNLSYKTKSDGEKVKVTKKEENNLYKDYEEDKIDHNREENKKEEKNNINVEKENLYIDYKDKEDKGEKEDINKDKDKYNNLKEKPIKKEEKVFKVDKYSIPNKISRRDKIKLISMSKELSVSDYGLLLEHIKRTDELEAAVDIFKILKNKLSYKDYKLIKEIFNPYINIELIEGKIWLKKEVK